MITQTLSALPPVTDAQRDAILNGPRTGAAHRAHLEASPALNAVQAGGTAPAPVLPATFNIVAWNIERCLFPEESAAHLSDIAPSVILLSEVDHGMARTGQRHTTEAFAAAMDMVYLFGVEFFELGLGGATERAFCSEDHNALGWHGNAILSQAPFSRSAMVRLDEDGHWFHGDLADPDQPRIGGRMALLAEIPTDGGSLVVVSTHLESNADAAFRHRQFEILLGAIDTFAEGHPVLIGGDLNTGNHLPPDFDWQRETLFALGEARGYSWGFTGDGMTTRPSLITPHPDRVMKLDWIAGRGVTCLDKGVTPSLTDSGKPLSDHDLVWARVDCAAR